MIGCKNGSNLKLNLRRQLATRLGGALFSALLLACPLVKADETGSLDNLWNEQSPAQAGGAAASGASSAVAEPSRPADQSTASAPTGSAGSAAGSATGTAASAPTGAVTSAPLCTWESFKSSSLVQGGGWPGVGPFKSEGDLPYEMSDAHQNKLKISVSEGKVTDAEIIIASEKPLTQDFLPLQMSADFLLEAVGIRAKKISDFNKDLSKNRDQVLFKSARKPVQVPVGRYLVSIFRQASGSGDQGTYNVRVLSQDASSDILKQHATGEDIVRVPDEKPPEPKVTGPTPEELKEQFAEVIKTWQKIKKVAVRQRQSGDLGDILSGRALDKQTTAISWLAKNHKFYEMIPKAVSVEKFTELSPGQKYAVFASVREQSKYIDETTGQTLKDTDDTYKVNYTVEKVGEKWLITDSALVSATSSAQAPKPPAKASR